MQVQGQACTIGLRTAHERRVNVTEDETWVGLGDATVGEFIIINFFNRSWPTPGIDLELKSATSFVDVDSGVHCIGEFAAFIFPAGAPDPAAPVRLGPLKQQFKHTIFVGAPPPPHAVLVGAFRANEGSCNLQIRMRPNQHPSGNQPRLRRLET